MRDFLCTRKIIIFLGLIFNFTSTYIRSFNRIASLPRITSFSPSRLSKIEAFIPDSVLQLGLKKLSPVIETAMDRKYQSAILVHESNFAATYRSPHHHYQTRLN